MWFRGAHDISLFFLQWHFISARESYLVCNGSITILKKSFKLTSRADIYPAKWPTEAGDYQKIKKDITFFFQCEIEMEQNWAKHRLCKHSKMFPNRLLFFFFAYALDVFLFTNSNNEEPTFPHIQGSSPSHWQHTQSFHWQPDQLSGDCVL